MHTFLNDVRGAGRRASVTAMALAASLALGACSDLLEVEDPDVATPGTLESETALPALRAGGIGDFTYAYSGGGGDREGQVLMSGIFTDELINSETFPTRIEVDRRNIQDINSSMETVYRDLHKARASLEFAIGQYDKFRPGDAEQSELYSLLGFTYVMFAENYCSGVPFSRLVAGVPEYGSPETTRQMLDRAVAAFTKAKEIATANGDAQLEQLASVGMGRAILNLGDLAGAAAAVADVDDDFVYEVEHSENTSRQENGTYGLININRRFSVANNEGVNGLDFIAASDKRVPIEAPDGPSDLGRDGITPVYRQLKYNARDASVALASGVEARLIEAEAELEGSPAAALGTLNALRTAAGITALTGPATVDMLFRERAFWLYLSSHRLGDMRRLVRQYGRDPNTVYPTGNYFKAGGPYSDDFSFPVPSDELNNPNFVSCNNEGVEAAI